jgi:type I restriction enzyme S subunit
VIVDGLKPYPTMKDSGVPWLGAVPGHWEVRRLRHLSRTPIRNGVGESAQAFRGDWPRYIRITDIAAPRRLKDSGKASLPPEFLQSAPVGKGDLLLAAVGATYGKAYLHNSEAEHACFAGYLVRWSPSQEVDPEWASYWTESAAYWDQVHSGVIKSTIENFSASRYRGLSLALPPLPEQAAIVRFLDHADRRIRRFIRAKQKLIKLLEEQKEAIIHHAVTRGLDPNVRLKPSGVEWLGEAPEHWEVSRVKNEFSCLNRRRVPLSATERGAMALRLYDYYGASGVIDRVNDYLFDDDLLLIAEDGANLVLRNLPLAIVARGKFWVNNHAHILKPKRGNLEYLAAVMEGINYKPWISGAAQPKLTQDRLMGIAIIVAPPDEQERIAKALNGETEALRTTIERSRREIDLLREYRTRLIADVVTGKLDVREAAAQLPDEGDERERLDEIEPDEDGDSAEGDDSTEVLEEAEA